MKQQQCKTSSILIDLENSSFKKLKEEAVIYQFSLPSFIQDSFNQYAILHNWAKDSLALPYYLNIPSKRIYVLVPKSEAAPDLVFDQKKLSVSVFNEYKSRDKVHLIVKLLLSKYFELNENFVSNDKFFLHASVNRNNTWATVLKVDITHNYKNSTALEFWVKDEANRLQKITPDEFQKFYQKEIIYGQSIRNGQLFFKQLKRKEIRDFQGILFAKPKAGFVGNSKTKINYHSILDHESSKAFLLDRFGTNFLRFLNDYGIQAVSKELNLTKIETSANRTGLEISGFKISLVDGRKVRDKKLAEIFQDSDGTLFTEKGIADLKEGDNCLFVMDYNKEDFDTRFKGETDPYKTFKENLSFKEVSKQGICINENYFDDDAGDSETTAEDYLKYNGLDKEDFQRNLSICINQLFLKNILLSKNAALLPRNEILSTHCFCFHNYLLYANGNDLRIEKYATTQEMLDRIAQKFTSLNVEKVFEDIYSYHNPFGSNKEFDFCHHRFIFNSDSVVEIVDMPERAFYDETEIKQRIADRNKQRIKNEFKSKNSDTISEQFNRLIDEDVENIMLSYEELKSKYGKGESGFLKQIFGSKDERPLLKFLAANTDLQIKGLKQDHIFSTYTGVWFDSSCKQYFVGRTLGYQQKQDKGVQMKKIVIYTGSFDEQRFFSLLNVDFIRYKEITVNPFPFKLIELYETIVVESIIETQV